MSRCDTKTFYSRAPLRMGLAGGGTDVSPYSDEHGGLVLNATIDSYIHCELRKSRSDEDVITFREFSADGEINAGTLQWAVYTYVCEKLNGGKDFRVFLKTISHVPVGSGLGGSSALVVAMLAAYGRMFNVAWGRYDLARAAFHIERNILGLVGGKQDQYASAFGGINVMMFPKGATDGLCIVNPLIGDWQFIDVMQNSMVLAYVNGSSRDSSQIIKHQNKVMNLPALNALKENVGLMRTAIWTKNLNMVSEILNRGWYAKKQLTEEITTDRIEDAINVAREYGATSAKLMGAGGGGHILFCVQPEKRQGLISRLWKHDIQARTFKFTHDGVSSWEAS